ncbi:hypothetical protein [Wielerella bovis]|uniref:hypothetical protein n=1 Tax=Wielerella bovis TaxID=2917790 RepID=UPI002018CC4F|nr:hypothetical protein [Wielerella bovis]ULJ61015.1 hypothetical protein MIS44_03955 [Wielerella bovis]
MVGISKLDAPFKLAQFSQNIVQALHQEFKKLDPNIDIFPVIKHNGISFEVKGEIAVNVSVKGKKNYFAMKNLLDYGYMVSEIDGFIDFPSPAIKKMHEIQGIQLGEGKISIEPKNKLQCPTDLIFKDKLNNEIWEIPTFANLYIGQKGFTINISLFNEIVTLTTEGVSFVEMKKGLSGKINLSINPNHILNKSIFELNSLESLVKFLRLLLEGNKPKIKIKSEHGELMSFSFSTTAQKIRNFIHRYFGDLNLILMLKTIAQYTNQNLEIRKNFGIDEKIYNDIRNCYRAIQGNYSQECKPSNIIRFTLLKSHNLNDFNLKETHSIKIDQEFDNPLFIMEQNFNLPKIAHCFSAVKFHKTDNISSLDMDISVEMKPQKGCFYQLVLVK